MTIQVDNAIPPNVVEIGNEITQGVVDGLMSASPAPSSSNPFFTEAGGTLTGTTTVEDANFDISNGNFSLTNQAAPDYYFYLGDGGQYFDDVAKDEFLFTPSEIRVRNQTTSLGTILNITGITFPDNTIQTTAATSPTFATTAQAQAGTSTTTVVSPATMLDAKYFQGGKSLNVNSYLTITSGTGAIAGAIGLNALQVAAPTTAIGTASRYGSIANSSRGLAYTGAFDFSKRVVIGGRFQKNSNTTDSNSVFRFYCGKTNTVQDVTAFDRAITFRAAGSGALQLIVANGSVLTTTTTTFTPIQSQCYDVLIVSESGTATMFVNGTQVATSSGSPTTTASNNFFGIEAQNIAIIATPAHHYMVTDLFAQVNL